LDRLSAGKSLKAIVVNAIRHIARLTTKIGDSKSRLGLKKGAAVFAPLLFLAATIMAVAPSLPADARKTGRCTRPGPYHLLS
jgi:hypothetical protein